MKIIEAGKKWSMDVTCRYCSSKLRLEYGDVYFDKKSYKCYRCAYCGIENVADGTIPDGLVKESETPLFGTTTLPPMFILPKKAGDKPDVYPGGSSGFDENTGKQKATPFDLPNLSR